jgi:hypothetical protein
MSFDAEFTRARFTPQTGPDAGTPIEVHFNPVSLQYQITNTVSRTGSGDTSKQHVSQASAKLTMDLVFDTTDSGDDVRSHTGKIANFMRPVGGDDNQNTPPVVEFAWGSYKFQGMVDSYRETLDFFAASGVPLRASVNLSMAGQDQVFNDGAQPSADAAAGIGGQISIGFGSPTLVASIAGDIRGARAVASINGAASLRFGVEGGLAVGGSIKLEGPVAFASAGAGFGAGASFGAGLSIGAGGGAAAGFGAGAAAGFAAGAAGGFGAGTTAGFAAGFGAGASAGVSASGGAFAGLRAGSAGASASLNPSRLIGKSSTATLSTDSGASFKLGGRATRASPAGLSANVSGPGLRAKIQFGD